MPPLFRPFSRAQEFSELILEREEESLEGSASQKAGSDEDPSHMTAEYSISEILSAVRRACLSRAAVPVVCGASLRGIGVEPLLDSVVAFLPSPLDRPRPTGMMKQSKREAGRKWAKRTRSGGATADEENRTRAEHADPRVDVDPLDDDLVAFVFKVMS